ncbi:translation elongation factor 4 [Candidatus Omnitrophota bacterium]
MDTTLIRNFCIIAHIDHGKSTLADRLLEMTSAVERREIREQMLDSMDLERERGITIKAKAVRLRYTAKDGKEYILNLIDTPGHVDFSYEVAKSLSASDGAVLLVDATQGIEAQTVVNFYLADNAGLKVIPALNKIDLPASQPERIKHQLEDVFCFDKDHILEVSAKDGTGVPELIEQIIREIPHPKGSAQEPLRAFLFDSEFDSYRGVILFARILEGRIAKGTEVVIVSKNESYIVEEVAVFTPKLEKRDELAAGEVGAIYCNIKRADQVHVPDYLIDKNNPTTKEIPECKHMPPMVFCGVFPSSPKDYDNLRKALEKLKLSDPSFIFEPDSSDVLGHGFRCGFLGLLHMEIVRERIERDYGIDAVLTSPNVKYQLLTTSNEEVWLDNPSKFPDPSVIKEIREPYIRASVLTPVEFMDPICELTKSRRGTFVKMDYLGEDRQNITFEVPFQEVIVDYYDNIKSVTKGYGSLEYEFIGFRASDIVKVDILFNRKPSGVFSLLLHKDKAERASRRVLLKLKELMPRHAFEVSLQAAIGSKIIAAEKKPAMKKDVTSKCYGGDITRKRKLWEKQKEGKRKMKMLGNVQIPSKAFLEILKL